MSIPTRDELIERVKTWLHAWVLAESDWQRLAELLDSEIRRAVIAELETLRATRVLLPAIDMKDPYVLGRHDEELTWANALEARLAALRQTEQPLGAEAALATDARIPDAQVTAGSWERAEGRAASSPCPPPATDEAAWLIELSAPGAPSVWLGKCGWTSPYFAIRFARESDARDAYALFSRVPSPHVRFTAHVWCAAVAPQSAQEPQGEG